jgi:hypothetical protein
MLFEGELSTLKRVVKAIGGKIEVKSDDIDTSFVLTVPCKFSD